MPSRRPFWFAVCVLASALACSASGADALGPPSHSTDGGSGAAAAGGMATGTGGQTTGGTTATGGTTFAGSGGSMSSTGGMPSGGSAGIGGGNPSPCSPPNDTPSPEVCDGLDNDLNGFIDEAGCPCTPGQTQPCFDGPPSQASAENCFLGTQTCTLSGEFGQWDTCEGSGCGTVTLVEECGNAADDDCDGIVDEGCFFDAEVNLDGDCLSAFCPPQASNPVGCSITMEGDDSRGCVSHLAGSPEVYFQEGNACPTCFPLVGCTGGAGRVYGTLLCSSDPAPVMFDATNCVINKAEPFYPTPSSTPIHQAVSGCPQ